MKKLVLAAAITTASAATHASVITSVFTGTDEEVLAYGAMYESYLTNATKETFENGYTTVQGGNSNSGSTVQTSVGTFTSVDPGVQGNYGTTLAMTDENNTIFYGRKNTTEGGSNYLDSNDSTKVIWDVELDPVSSFTNIGFYLSDADDVEAFLDIDFYDGTTQTISLKGNKGNGQLQYFTAQFDPSVTYASIVFNNHLGENGGWADNDGWAIDDIVVGTVPEPSSLALLGLGLVGAGMARYNKKS